MSDLLLPFEIDEMTVDIIELESFEYDWCLTDPTDGIIDSLTDFDDIDDFEKLMAKEKAYLDTL